MRPIAIVTLSGGTQPAELPRARRPGPSAAWATPRGFYRTLEGLGIRLAGRTTFNDHHAYVAADLAGVIKDADAAGAELILTTAKDAVKLAGLEPALAGRIAWLQVELAFLAGEEGLRDSIGERRRRCRPLIPAIPPICQYLR